MKQGKIQAGTVCQYYSKEGVVDHYAHATAAVGLWLSEEKIFQRVFKRTDQILELGCGTGRIAMGLHELGYKKLFATDVSRKMVSRARNLCELMEYDVPFGVQDATQLQFADNSFDGVIFGFNGLMQIPGRDKRLKAMNEIARVLRVGGWFVFTAHDRHASEQPSYWKSETKHWKKGTQDDELIDFGDRIGATPWGDLYIHVPESNEIRADLKQAGFRVDVDVLRSQIAEESKQVREFSDECRFWIAQKR